MQRLRIKHVTEYHYPAQVMLNQHRLLLRPREGHDVRIESSKLVISPAYSIEWQRDVLDNSLAIVHFFAPSHQLTISSEVIIQHYERAPHDIKPVGATVQYPFSYDAHEQMDLAAFQTPMFLADQALVQRWLQQFNLHGMDTFSLLMQLNQAVHQQFNYQVREEVGVQSPATTLSKMSGSCRDYATLLIEACRYLGLASRFVSGYLHAPATEVGNASTHAWVEVYLPNCGWQGFDPTSGEVVGNCHIAVAVARDPEAVSPVSGSFVGVGLMAPLMVVNVQVNLMT